MADVTDNFTYKQRPPTKCFSNGYEGVKWDSDKKADIRLPKKDKRYKDV